MGVDLVEFTTLALRRDGPVLHITLNRPEVRNAMSLAMVRELRVALAQSEMSGVTRVIVVRGAGGHFCAGADLKDMATARLLAKADDPRVQRDDQPNVLLETNAAFGDLCVAFASTPLATVAVLEGSVMGGGFGLACAADVAIAAEGVAFRLPETALGLVPAQIAPFLVERLGYAEAKRLAVTGGRLDAQEALTLRLVHAVHAVHQLDAAVARLLNEMLQCAPGAVAATKALLALARFAAPATLVQEAAAVFARAALGPEGCEGATAFLQKRKATWVPQ